MVLIKEPESHRMRDDGVIFFCPERSFLYFSLWLRCVTEAGVYRSGSGSLSFELRLI